MSENIYLTTEEKINQMLKKAKEENLIFINIENAIAISPDLVEKLFINTSIYFYFHPNDWIVKSQQDIEFPNNLKVASMIDEAKCNNLWLYLSKKIFFSPEELEDLLTSGFFILNIDLWSLKKPYEISELIK